MSFLKRLCFTGLQDATLEKPEKEPEPVVVAAAAAAVATPDNAIGKLFEIYYSGFPLELIINRLEESFYQYLYVMSL